MTCDHCKQRPATVHLTRIINGHKTEMHLCQECARERGEMSFLAEPSFTFHNILAGLFEPEGVLGPRTAVRPKVRCHNCGLSFSDFRRLGQLGCSECYLQFEQELEPLIRRIHGSTRHVGKVPGRVNGEQQRRRELERLRRELQEAVAREEYERAAALRDRIRALETKS